jgi:hypothetical protein
MVNMMLRRNSVVGILRTLRLPEPKLTSVEELLLQGYRLRNVDEMWGTEQVGDFFGACQKYRRDPRVIGNYQDVYEWISRSILKGAMSTRQVRLFGDRMYNSNPRRKRKLPITAAADIAEDVLNEEGDENEAVTEEGYSEEDYDEDVDMDFV